MEITPRLKSFARCTGDLRTLYWHSIVRRLSTSPVKRTEYSVFAQPLVGHRLRSLENRDYSWFFVFADDLSVVTEFPWRFIADGCIAITSEDDGHQFGLPAPVDAAEMVLHRTSGQDVIAASIDPDTGDLSIEFSGMLRLQLLQMSAGYGAWRIYAPGAEVVCTGGGDIA